MPHLWPLHQANKEPSGLNVITLHLGELSLKTEDYTKAKTRHYGQA